MIKFYIVIAVILIAFAGYVCVAYEDMQYKKREKARIEAERKAKEASMSQFEKDIVNSIADVFFGSLSENVHKLSSYAKPKK